MMLLSFPNINYADILVYAEDYDFLFNEANKKRKAFLSYVNGNEKHLCGV